MRFDMLDYPTAWEIQNKGGLTHLERCSSVPGWHSLSGPALLCDCGAIEREWERLRINHQGPSISPEERAEEAEREAMS